MQYTQLQHMINPYTKSSEFPWMTDTYVWRDDAACAFSPPELFELDENNELSSEDFEQAKKDCDRCPVWHLCYSSSAPEDFVYTVRAGLKPAPEVTAPETTLKKERQQSANKERMLASIEQHKADLDAINHAACQRGHVGNFVKSASYGIKCRSCKVEGLPAKEQPEYPWCEKGHVNWTATKSGVRVCRTCRRMVSFRRQAAYRTLVEAGTLEA